LYKSRNNKALLDKKSLTTNSKTETGDETFAWESFEKKLSAYSFLKYLVQENGIHVDLPGLKTFLSFSETTSIEQNSYFQCQFQKMKEKS
jgi:hypothetical protein